MGFDKNGDGKVTKDELPERMQGLLEQADTNRDGALDREEVKRFADRGPPGGPPGAPFPKRP
jgi:Ca2+-binding EF-hand superfamily protein